MNDEFGRSQASQQSNAIEILPIAAADSPEAALVGVVALVIMPGGVSSLHALVLDLPATANVAYVVSCQLPADQSRQVFAWLRSQASMPVVELEHTAALRANHLHLLPPDMVVEAPDNRWHLRERGQGDRRVLPTGEAVDRLLMGLAAVFGERLAVLLLGSSGVDGCTAMLGVDAVKDRNGLVLAPDAGPYRTLPSTASTAPAQAAVEVDLVLSPQQLLQRLRTWAKRLQPEQADDVALRAELQRSRTPIEELLYRYTSYNFGAYDPDYVRGRLLRRMHLRSLGSGEAYLRILASDEDEARRLAADLLASHSYFFRESAAFRILGERVIPRLVADRTAGDTVRVWSVGCAGGEEAYSLAMVLLDHLREREHPPATRVFASDVNRIALQRGRSGNYCSASLANVGEERLHRYFVGDFLGYSVAPALREAVYFAQHDVLVDPPFARLDLIACRNLLPDLHANMRDQLLELFALALHPHGCLMLGMSDEMPRADLFRPLDGEARLYMRREPSVIRHRAPAAGHVRIAGGDVRAPAAERVDFAALLAALRGAEGPPSLLVDEAGSIVYADAEATMFLHQPAGEPTALLQKLVVPELQWPATTVLQQAQATQAEAGAPAQAVLVGGAWRKVQIAAAPVADPRDPNLLLVQFHDAGPIDAPIVALEPPNRAEHETPDDIVPPAASLESTAEIAEIAQNEEQQLLIEELRVTLDELEWRKREQDEANRQLTDVNRLYAEKIAELNRLAGDLQNLLIATDVVTVFIDRNLAIKRFTPNAGELFHLQPADLGRRISDIAPGLQEVKLDQDANSVLEQYTPVEREVQDEVGRWHLMRVLPYRTLEGAVDGVVFTFVDITRQKEADAALRRNEERLRLAVNAGRVGIYDHVIAADVTIGTPLYYEIMHMPPDNAATRQQWLDVIHPDDRDWIEAELVRVTKEGGQRQFECRIVLPDGGIRWIGCSSVTLSDANGKPERITGAIQDITERKDAEAALREWNAELETRVADRTQELERSNRELDQFAYVASHDLKAPLRAIVSLARWINEDAGDVLPAQSKEHLDKLVGRTRRMETLLDDLLGYSRVTRQRHPTVVVDTAELVNAICDLLELPPGFRVAVASDMPVLTTERVPLETVLRNLISNAIKHHNHPEQGVMQVSAMVHNEMAEFTVADNGPGIDPAHHERIFQIFQTLKPRSEVEGSGMGLAVVKRLVENRGGRVWIESALGQGAAFRFTWPAR